MQAAPRAQHPRSLHPPQGAPAILFAPGESARAHNAGSDEPAGCEENVLYYFREYICSAAC